MVDGPTVGNNQFGAEYGGKGGHTERNDVAAWPGNGEKENKHDELLNRLDKH